MTVAKIDFTIMEEATLCLKRRLGATIAIAAIGMLLAALAALLQIYYELPEEPIVILALVFVSRIPLDLYFVPRFLMSCDAEMGQSPLNTLSEWRVKFEERWLRSYLGNILVGIVAVIGLSLLVLPGIIIYIAFVWVPLCILLRGESITQAVKSSLAMTKCSWQKVTIVVIGTTLVYVILSCIISVIMYLIVKNPTAYTRLVNPIVWIGNFLERVLGLWLCSCFLVLYNRLEKKVALEKPQ